MPRPAEKISRALKKLLSSVWRVLASCCRMSECLDEPLLGTKVSRGRSGTQQPRRYSARKRSYLRGDTTASPSPSRTPLNPFDDDALNRGAATGWNTQDKLVPTAQDSAAEIPLSTPFRHFKPFNLDDEQHDVHF
jgi:hypothetical protein